MSSKKESTKKKSTKKISELTGFKRGKVRKKPTKGENTGPHKNEIK